MQHNHPDWQFLVVEDEQDSAAMLKKILNYHGIEVHVARNGEECMLLLQTLAPTLIITDLAMPGMDGWRTLEAVRANTTTQHIPVVAITVYDSVDVAEEAEKAGFDAYFSKPLNPRAFIQSLEKLLTK